MKNTNFKYKQLIVGNSKHYPTANKEWKDSVYSYDKTYMKPLSVKNKITSKLITSYFNIVNLKYKSNSRRARIFMIRKSNKKIFVSKSYIKHFNDKIIVNIYIHNRQKEFLVRKLFFFKRKHNLFEKWLNSFNVKSLKIKAMRFENKSKKSIFFDIIRKHENIRNKNILMRLPFYGIKYKNELDYLRYRTLNIYRNLNYYNNMFFFIFFSKILFMFNIKIFMPLYSPANTDNLIKNIMINKPNTLIWLDNNLNKLNLVSNKYININLLKTIMSKYSYKYNDIILINKYIIHYIQNRLINTGMLSKYNFINIYTAFKKKYYVFYMYKLLEKTDEIIYYLNRLDLDNTKFSSLLYNLKVLISRVYNKKVELNITNLKYPFLNSDVYTKITVDKAKKKKSILRVLASSLNLSTKPTEIFYNMKENLRLNDYDYLSNNKSLNLTDLLPGDNYIDGELNYLISRIYPNHLISNKPVTNNYLKGGLNKINTILNTIKFKWVSGVKLQVAGRVTRRYTAARSVLKFKHKGNFRNKEQYIKDNKIKIMSTVMIRNNVKSNSQYTFMKSKRRIGSFGIKSWVSSY